MPREKPDIVGAWRLSAQAARIVRSEILALIVALHFRQHGNAMALLAAVQGRAGQMRNIRLKQVGAIVQGQHGPQALLTMLYLLKDRLNRCGVAVKNLAHNASTHPGQKISPTKSGIKHLSQLNRYHCIE